MAAIRVGMAYGHQDVIQLMNNVKAPYNVNRLSEELAVKALSNLALYRERVEKLIEGRKAMQDVLRKEPYVRRVLESDANFFLVQIDNAHTIYKHMAENGIVVRFRGTELHCEDCLRLTVSLPKDAASVCGSAGTLLIVRPIDSACLLLSLRPAQMQKMPSY
jgi:histidinol-phosphate aminotransferase